MVYIYVYDILKMKLYIHDYNPTVFMNKLHSPVHIFWILGISRCRPLCYVQQRFIAECGRM